MNDTLIDLGAVSEETLGGGILHVENFLECQTPDSGVDC